MAWSPPNTPPAACEGLGFALPINDVIDIANDLITKGYVRASLHGHHGNPNMPRNVAAYYNVPTGSYVYFIEAGSAAEKPDCSRRHQQPPSTAMPLSGNSRSHLRRKKL